MRKDAFVTFGIRLPTEEQLNNSRMAYPPSELVANLNGNATNDDFDLLIRIKRERCPDLRIIEAVGGVMLWDLDLEGDLAKAPKAQILASHIKAPARALIQLGNKLEMAHQSWSLRSSEAHLAHQQARTKKKDDLDLSHHILADLLQEVEGMASGAAWKRARGLSYKSACHDIDRLKAKAAAVR